MKHVKKAFLILLSIPLISCSLNKAEVKPIIIEDQLVQKMSDNPFELNNVVSNLNKMDKDKILRQSTVVQRTTTYYADEEPGESVNYSKIRDFGDAGLVVSLLMPGTYEIYFNHLKEDNSFTISVSQEEVYFFGLDTPIEISKGQSIEEVKHGILATYKEPITFIIDDGRVNYDKVGTYPLFVDAKTEEKDGEYRTFRNVYEVKVNE